jgi:Fic family protein
MFIFPQKMNIDPKLPHNALLDLPPTVDLETTGVLKAAIVARDGLHGLRDACRMLPSPEMLMNTLPVLEANDSSAIENIITTADELFRYDGRKPDENDLSAKEAHNYCSALRRGWEGIRGGRPISTSLTLEIASVLLGIDVCVRNHSVALADAATGQVHYTPPGGGEIVWQKLKNWENFINGPGELDPLIKLAVAHYQFEAIHPLRDGNGRTGRILNLLLLVRDHFLDAPILYMSHFILQNRSEYYRLLRRVTFQGEWEPWILFLMDAIGHTARWTVEKIEKIRAAIAEADGKIRANFPKVYSPRLMEILFSQPYRRIRNFVEAGIAGRQTAAKYIDALVSIGILEPYPSPGPEKLYANKKFLQILL